MKNKTKTIILLPAFKRSSPAKTSRDLKEARRICNEWPGHEKHSGSGYKCLTWRKCPFFNSFSPLSN
jgi:hypothetical protein